MLIVKLCRQVLEMKMSGWRFLVLSPAFAVHWGFQERRTRPQWRERQVYENSKKMGQFKLELETKFAKKEEGDKTKKGKRAAATVRLWRPR